jgi:hypothetical protein
LDLESSRSKVKKKEINLAVKIEQVGKHLLAGEGNESPEGQLRRGRQNGNNDSSIF